MDDGDRLAGQLGAGIELGDGRIFLMSPRKILASVGPSITRSPDLTPSMFTTGTMPPMTMGNWARPDSSSSLPGSGASEAPKVTVLALICLMPPPEPIDW
jgi:hypothetical protein